MFEHRTLFVQFSSLPLVRGRRERSERGGRSFEISPLSCRYRITFALSTDSSSRTPLPEAGAGTYIPAPTDRAEASPQAQLEAPHAQGRAARELCLIYPRHRKRSGSLFPERR